MVVWWADLSSTPHFWQAWAAWWTAWQTQTKINVTTPAHAGLRELTLCNTYNCNYSLAAATQLTSLQLVGEEVDIDFRTMPPSLRKLFVRDLPNVLVPRLIAALGSLTRLEELSVHDLTVYFSEVNEFMLQANCRAVASLTRLTHLALTRVGPFDCSFLSGATLPRLRSLWLDTYPLHGASHVPALPAAAPCLTSLKLSLACASDMDSLPLPLPLGRPGAPDLSRYPRLSDVMLHFVELDAEAALHLCSLRSMPSPPSLRLDLCKMADRSRRKLMRAGAVFRYDGDCTDFMDYDDWLL